MCGAATSWGVSLIPDRIRVLVAALLVAAPRGKAVQAYVSCDSQGIVCRAGRGLIRDSDLGLAEALWVGPESKGIYIGSPSIWKTAAGPVVASHDFFGRSTLNATTQVLLDKSGRGSGGASRWVHAGNCSNMYWSSLFAHPHPQRQHELYLLGVSGASGNGGGAAGSAAKPPLSFWAHVSSLKRTRLLTKLELTDNE